MKKMKPTIVINIDKAIEVWNQNNLDKPKMTRQNLFDLLDNKITRKTLQNWKNGKVPKAFNSINQIIKITGCKISDIINIQKDGSL